MPHLISMSMFAECNPKARATLISVVEQEDEI